MYHLIIYCPIDHTDAVRTAAADAGAGKIGNYDSCSFSTKGTGRFRGQEGSNPAIGKEGALQQVQEERIEMIAPEELIKDILRAIVDAHPYEEPAIHVLPMLDYKDLL